MTKRTSIKLKPSTHKRLKLASATIDQPMNELADIAILEWLTRNRKRIAMPSISDLIEAEPQATGVPQ